VLHASSFSAWRALPGSRMGREPGANAVLDGYHAQAELVSVAVQAAIQRALTERVSLVIEGVHLHPAVLQRVPHDTDAIVVPILLAVLKPEQLRARIRGRGRKVPDRRTERYLDHFDDIWRLQSDLLSQAEQDPRNSIYIIVNDNKEKAIRQVMSTIIDALAHAFSRDSEARTGND
jgi:2-phosphoglycerate kinase